MEFPTLTGKGCEVKIIEASISQHTSQKLITFSLRYWRPIHTEVMTHRKFTRNASSSRAIPTAKLLEEVRTNPAGPVHWGKNQPGMQAHEEHEGLIVHPRTGRLMGREEAWSTMASENADWAEAWAEAGYHKQIVNRIIEPYSRITVLVTSTDWDNWYSLRAHVDAQPEIQDLAYTMLKLVPDVPSRNVHEGKLEDARTWHLPFVSMQERVSHSVPDLLAMSAARCARVSYLTHDKQNPTLEQDDGLYRRLVESKPLHASPLEHQAHCTSQNRASRNFDGGWLQHRALLESAGSIENFRSAFEARV
jgi:hypothetical protein